MSGGPVWAAAGGALSACPAVEAATAPAATALTVANSPRRATRSSRAAAHLRVSASTRARRAVGAAMFPSSAMPALCGRRSRSARRTLRPAIDLVGVDDDRIDHDGAAEAGRAGGGLGPAGDAPGHARPGRREE